VNARNTSRGIRATRRTALVLAAALIASTVTTPAFAGPEGKPLPEPNVALGEALFVGYCSTCHTFKAAGATAIYGPNLNKYPPPSLAYVKYQITHGGSIMPAFTRFNPQQVADIAAFVWTKR
jgi:mono/diheme cytochrome c family protein